MTSEQIRFPGESAEYRRRRDRRRRDELLEAEIELRRATDQVAASRPDDGGEVRHFWGTELMYAAREEGQDPRYVDFIWPIWNLFDFTPEGRGTGREIPQLSYD